jgi:hypothetical protein
MAREELKEGKVTEYIMRSLFGAPVCLSFNMWDTEPYLFLGWKIAELVSGDAGMQMYRTEGGRYVIVDYASGEYASNIGSKIPNVVRYENAHQLRDDVRNNNPAWVPLLQAAMYKFPPLTQAMDNEKPDESYWFIP